MKRMWSKNELKNIGSQQARDEIQEVIPTPSVAESGKVIQVGADGKYGLAPVEGATALYCHPIQIERVEDNVQTAELTMLIFNNSPTQFTKTTFLDWLDNLFSTVGSTIRIMASGGWKSNNSLLVASYIGKYSADSYYLMGMTTSGIANIETLSRAQMEDFISSITDGVNQLL